MAELRLVGLTKRFGSFTAVDDLNLCVGDGELLALLGPSGCGKTTTLRCISGFELPDEGDVFFGDKQVTLLPPEQRNIGMVFQNYALFPHMTVYENIAFGLRLRRCTKAEIHRRVCEVLERVGLSGAGERYPRQLSGGQQQRVALARALVISPSLLLLDEPLANLDAKLREEMRFYIRSLQKNVGITAVYVTHDQAEAMVLADRVAVMFAGKLAQIGPPAEVYRHPATPEVAQFIGLANFLTGSVQEILESGCKVMTSVGLVECAESRGLGVGEKVLLTVRPEAISLHRHSARVALPGQNIIRGVIKESAFLGNTVDYWVEVGDGLLVRVQGSPIDILGLGTEVDLSFSPSSSWLIPAEH
ncbi:ABC transporter ATP-binding protein [Neomoorella mulderi]|uniref:Sulfate/thiosulfate import ATP-binding protein CysA n=1 Tax=Moorella mulderi DSM 14980 TaxID=1122241 RepID=A0A151AVE4_9FIRM|nr:ABC transporter ATP-binding protein [Moorella mulderi]KYH31625.1 sulfate/thiosulfate import ATP-binding protein CysA [Moorella mulderi DSM 14980]